MPLFPRMVLVSSILAAAVVWTAAAEPAGPDSAAPPGGRTMLDESALLSKAMKSVGERTYATFTAVDVARMPFDKAMRVHVTEQPVKYYHVQVKFMRLPAFEKGDVMLATFWARCTEGGQYETGTGELRLGLQRKEDNETFGKFIAQPPAEWQQYFVPMTATYSAAAGEAAFLISFGGMKQAVEIGGLRLVNYGASVAQDALPRTVLTYAGREPDAPWRAEAERRIEKHRKADLRVLVTDDAGNPVPDAQVEVKMQRHAFLFGAAITARSVQDTPITRPILEHHAKLFNQGLPISWMYWRDVDDSDARHNADRIYAYMRKNRQVTRAHALMYERDDLIPPHIRELIDSGQTEKLRAAVEQYITEQVLRFKGRVDEWVIENEAVDNNRIRAALGGDAAMAEFFKLVARLDPAAKLMINENRLEGLKPDKSDRLLELVRIVEANGGRIDTIGIQGHMQSAPVPPETLLRHFDKLAATGKTLAITEFDYAIDDAQLKADYLRDFYTTVFSHPSFNCITIWRFWDGKPEKNESVIFAHDWSLRPSGQVYKDLVFGRWWTNESGRTDAAGRYAVRGFLGEYLVTVSTDGRSRTLPLVLRPDQSEPVKIVLK